MQAESAELKRFRLGGLLGEGADLQVFSAVDSENGRQVVVKRPHPSLIERRLHGDVDESLARSVTLRQRFPDLSDRLPELVHHFQTGSHDSIFGDRLKNPYSVIVETRARGVPLVGSIVDGVKGRPIGLPQNLFALYPLVVHRDRGRFTIQRDILDIAERFHIAGFLPLDLRPQNVFFDPRDASISLVDLGQVTVERAPSRRQRTVDIHDFHLEFFKWYGIAGDAPTDPKAYGRPRGTDSVTMFPRDLDIMIKAFADQPPSPLAETAVIVLERVRERGYGDFGEFRRDLEKYLSLAEERLDGLTGCSGQMDAWRRAAEMLCEPIWQRYLFDPHKDLAAYDCLQDSPKR